MRTPKILLAGLAAAFILAPAIQAMAQALPAPVIAVIDGNRILRESTAAQTLTQEINALGQRFGAEIEQQEAALMEEQERVRQAMISVGDVARAQLESDFQGKVAAWQQDRARKEQEIRDANEIALSRISQALGPVMEELSKQTGVTLFIDKRSVMFGGDAIDLTTRAIEILNVSFPVVTLDLPANAPAQ